MKEIRLFLLCFAFISACEGRVTSRDWKGETVLLPNGAVEINNPADGLWDPGQAWVLSAIERLGSVEGGNFETFGSIRDFSVDQEGRVYVLDGHALEVRVFSRRGQFIRAVGGYGEGPGEFQQAAGLAMGSAGTFWVADPLQARYTQFDTSGALRRVLSPRVIARDWNLVFPWQGAVGRDDRVYDYTWTPDGTRLVSIRPGARNTIEIDTFNVPFGDEAELKLLDPQGGIVASMPVPFRHRLIRTVDPRGFLWVGDNSSYKIVQQHLNGDTVKVIYLAHTPIPVTEAEVTSALSPAATILEMGGRLSGPPIPKIKPAFRWFSVDDDGFLWVCPYGDEVNDGRVLDVFDPEGRYLGEVRADFQFDTSFPIRIKGKDAYALVRDTFDVQNIMRARVMGR